MPSNRRDRSRSPLKGDSIGFRREPKDQDSEKHEVSSMSMNHMMMPNMFAQGNMMMAGGVFPNMMMPNMIGSGMMQPTGMEVMGGSGMELVPQTAMDMSSMGASSISNSGNNPMEMGMMGGMLMDPSMMSMYPAMSAEMTPTHEGKELVFKYCKLLPPEPGKPQPLRRTRPPGCRTIFVGGLPEKIRESIVREIFETYGRIITLRLSKKNFCHIRFDRESSVEAAMVVSGCRLVLTGSKDKDKDEKEEESRLNSGWIHVDYALSRDDQNEYERRQRQALRVQQAQIQEINSQQEIRRRNPEENQRWSPSPPRVMIFSSATVGQVAEKIKSEEHFSSTISTLLAWLERGECSKKTASQFYSMIQSTNSHIRRLFSEKMQAEDELTECKERVRNRIASVIELLEQVAKVFVAATHQRVWDHFTKPQRKNIETWQKMTQEFKTLKEEFNEKFNDDDYNENEKKSEVVIEELQDLKRENESLQFQLEAYKNEIDVIKSDTQKEMEKFKAQFIARQALQKNFDRNPPLPETQAKAPTPPPPSPPKYSNQKPQIKEVVEAKCGEAKLIGVMSAFLQEKTHAQHNAGFTTSADLPQEPQVMLRVHPQGASLDYVVSYVRALFPNITQVTIHHVLQKHSDVFKRTTSGVGVNIEHKWSFIALSQHEKNS